MEVAEKTGALGWVVESRLPELEARLAKANKQAKKLGLPPLVLSPTGNEKFKVVKITWNGFDRKYKVHSVEMEIIGDAPKLPGDWTLLAVLNHEEGLPIVKTVPGRVLPLGQRDRGMVCDHCKKSILRKDTFVLDAVDGRVVQVGRNCLADFLGVSNFSPTALLAFASFILAPFEGLDDWSDDEGGYGRQKLLLDVKEVVVASGAVIDTDGWVSRARSLASYEAVKPTSDSVSLILWPIKNAPDGFRAWVEKVKANMTPALDAEADAALAWAKSLMGNPSDYLNNLAVLASREMVGQDKFGLLVSLIATYRREMETLRERERNLPSEWVGTVGKREEFTLTLTSKPRAFEGSYGTSYRVEFKDAAGNVFIWWASNNPATGEAGWQVDETRTVKASVKKHDGFKGVKQTVITRVS